METRPDLCSHWPGARFLIPAGQYEGFENFCRENKIQIRSTWRFNGIDTKAWVVFYDNPDVLDQDAIEKMYEILAASYQRLD